MSMQINQEVEGWSDGVIQKRKSINSFGHYVKDMPKKLFGAEQKMNLMS